MSKPSSRGALLGGVKKAKENWGRSGYFAERARKLAEQAPKSRTLLLEGLTFYFTGVKSHSQMHLSRKVWENGGSVLPMWQRRKVTHVVADNLAASKVHKELKQFGAHAAWKGVVVKPNWITDCLRRRKRLPVHDYRVVEDKTITDIRSYFGKRTKSTSKDCNPKTSC